MASISVKIGQTLLLNVQALQDDGTPIDITNMTFTSSVQDVNGNPVASLTPAVVNAPLGQFTLASATTGWPAGTLNFDVCCVQNGTIFYSQTGQLLATLPITPPPGS